MYCRTISNEGHDRSTDETREMKRQVEDGENSDSIPPDTEKRNN